MNRAAKATIGTAAVVAALAAAMAPENQPVRYRLTESSGVLHGEEAPYQAGDVDLMKLNVRPNMPKRPWMRHLPVVPGSPTRGQAENFTGLREDGSKVRLEFMGAMPMEPGETLEEARKRFWGDRYEALFPSPDPD